MCSTFLGICLTASSRSYQIHRIAIPPTLLELLTESVCVKP